MPDYSTINIQSRYITRDAADHIVCMRRYALEAIDKARGKRERILVRACKECDVSFETRSRHPRSRCPDCYGLAHYAGMKARAEVNRAIALGRLMPADRFRCTDCPEWATEYEHRDYSRPLAVEPVCASCNCRRGPGSLGNFFGLSQSQAVSPSSQHPTCLEPRS